MRARALDIKDVSQRLIANIQGIELTDFQNTDEPVIVVAEELTPSASAH